MMVIDGKQIAKDIQGPLKQEVIQRGRPPTLFVIVVGDDHVSEKFIAQKSKFADEIGVHIRKYRFSKNTTEQEVIDKIQKFSCDNNAGIIVQLPLPKNFDTQKILNAISSTHDVDVLSEESVQKFENGSLLILPPVIGAIKEILERNNVIIKDKKIVVIGKGRLVGIPADIWLRGHRGDVVVIDEHTPDISAYTKKADIIISGAGVPGLITPDKIKEGVALLDAGTSEEGSKVVGDADTRCADKAGLFTPVPGGIGPITVAILFRNLLTLTRAY